MILVQSYNHFLVKALFYCLGDKGQRHSPCRQEAGVHLNTRILHGAGHQNSSSLLRKKVTSGSRVERCCSGRQQSENALPRAGETIQRLPPMWWEEGQQAGE